MKIPTPLPAIGTATARLFGRIRTAELLKIGPTRLFVRVTFPSTRRVSETWVHWIKDPHNPTPLRARCGYIAELTQDGERILQNRLANPQLRNLK